MREAPAHPTAPADDYESAAELFGVLSAPVRLRVIGALCGGEEKNVSQLLQEVGISQPNMSQQLHVLYRAGVVDKRRDGAQIYYRIADESVVQVCKAICASVRKTDKEIGTRDDSQESPGVGTDRQ